MNAVIYTLGFCVFFQNAWNACLFVCVAGGFSVLGRPSDEASRGMGRGRGKTTRSIPLAASPLGRPRRDKTASYAICRRIDMETLSISPWAHASFVTNIKFCDILNVLLTIWSCFLIFCFFSWESFLILFPPHNQSHDLCFTVRNRWFLKPYIWCPLYTEIGYMVIDLIRGKYLIW